MTKKFLFVLAIIIIFMPLFAKQLVNGVVFDNESKDPIIGANISAIISKSGTSTNGLGEFNLELTDSDSVLFIKHIAYDSVFINLVDNTRNIQIGLDQKIIPFQKLDVLGQGDMGKFNQLETKNMVSKIQVDNISIRSLSDIGDILLNEESVTISENSTGFKTLSIRGARQEEVAYMFDGIKMYNGGRRPLDLSMLDIGGLEAIEFLRGSHESASGSSAVINFIPKLAYKNNANFYQRFGTYDTGSYHTGFSLGNSQLSLGYSIGGGRSRQFYKNIEDTDVDTELGNKSISIGYKPFLNTELRYYQLNNSRTYNNFFNKDSIGSRLSMNTIKLDYDNKVVGDFEVYVSTQYTMGQDKIDQLQTDREDSQFTTGLNYLFPLDNASLELSYRNSLTDAEWNTFEGDIALKREHASFSGVFELTKEKTKEGLEIKDIKISLNSNIIEENSITKSNILNPNASWNEMGTMASISAWDNLENVNILLFSNIGNNFRLPSIAERYAHSIRPDIFLEDTLLTEYKIMKEVGAKFISRNTDTNSNLSGSFSYFHYDYVNKIKTIQYGGTSLQFPINDGSAFISGIELNMHFNTFNNKLGFKSIYSSYNFSDQLTFQLQPRTISRQYIILSIGSFKARFGIKNEGKRVMTTFDRTNSMVNNYLDKHRSIDISLSHIVKFREFKFSVGVFGQNLNDDSQVLDGISVFDKRIYVSMGLEWN